MSVILPLPEKMDFESWAQRFIEAFPDAFVQSPEKDESWITWAEKIFLNPQFAKFPRPVPLAYPKKEDWKEWATQVINFL